MSVRRQFIKYVSQNVLGMVGISLYILADTFFISEAVGADGITALNLVLPIYSIIFAIGAMLGVGSSIRYAVARNQGRPDVDTYFVNALFWGTLVSLVFVILGVKAPDKVMMLFGADADIVRVGVSYTRIFMVFAPCFVWNHICNAFVRNDGAPTVAMAATLSSSLFNIVMDYVFMFPLGMGMAGAALATAVSPLIGVAVCCIHLLSKRSHVSLRWKKPSFRRLMFSCQVGISALVGEISSGVITVLFNMLILDLAGNVGVAAYGVVANIALVAIAVCNGISQGMQPLISACYAQGKHMEVKQLLWMGVRTVLTFAIVLVGCMYIWTTPIANLFNRDHDVLLETYAIHGLKLYFIGFLFAGINIVGTGIFSAMEEAKASFVISLLRGFVLICLSALLLAHLFGMTGVWLAFPVAEALTLLFVFVIFKKRKYI